MIRRIALLFIAAVVLSGCMQLIDAPETETAAETIVFTETAAETVTIAETEAVSETETESETETAVETHTIAVETFLETEQENARAETEKPLRAIIEPRNEVQTVAESSAPETEVVVVDHAASEKVYAAPIENPTEAAQAPDASRADIGETWEYCGSYRITAYMWTGYRMANGEWPDLGWCASGEEFPFGTVLYVDGFGYYTVGDRGVYNGQVDLYMETYEACMTVGLQYRDVWVVK